MIYEEAIENIKESMNDSSYTYSYSAASNQPMNEALELAIVALGKQIPMKPNARFYPDGSVESVCQNCKDVVEEGLFIYCPNCGQAIDWRED